MPGHQTLEQALAEQLHQAVGIPAGHLRCLRRIGPPAVGPVTSGSWWRTGFRLQPRARAGVGSATTSCASRGRARLLALARCFAAVSSTAEQVLARSPSAKRWRPARSAALDSGARARRLSGQWAGARSCSGAAVILKGGAPPKERVSPTGKDHGLGSRLGQLRCGSHGTARGRRAEREWKRSRTISTQSWPPMASPPATLPRQAGR